MTAYHPDNILPLEFLASIHISLTEAEFMKVDLNTVRSYRKDNGLMDSDDLPEEIIAAIGDKRSRSLSASSVGGSKKNPRLQ